MKGIEDKVLKYDCSAFLSLQISNGFKVVFELGCSLYGETI